MGYLFGDIVNIKSAYPILTPYLFLQSMYITAFFDLQNVYYCVAAVHSFRILTES